MKRVLLDAGFMGCILSSWIKLVRAVKHFLSKHTYFIERNTVVRSVFTNTMEEKVDSSTNWSRLIQLLLRGGRNLGMMVWLVRGYVNLARVLSKKENIEEKQPSSLLVQRSGIRMLNGLGIMLDTGLPTHGYTGIMDMHVFVKTESAVF